MNNASNGFQRGLLLLIFFSLSGLTTVSQVQARQAVNYPGETEHVEELKCESCPCYISRAGLASSYDADREPGTYYVSPQGNDNNPGTRAQPWLTIQFAVNQAIPGDSLLVDDGIYDGPVYMTRSGAPDAYITLKSINLWEARVEVLDGVGKMDGIKACANYLTIDGFELYDPKNAVGHHGNGITVYENHHVNILNNRIHDFGGSGIQMGRFDHVLIENNVVYNNANHKPNQSSGISLWQARAVDDAPGYHIIVRNNRSYGNFNIVLNPKGVTTDGNGIFTDDFWNSMVDPTNVVFPHRTLFENNLSYNNGGKGIHVFKSNHVDLFNNTAYHNNRDDKSIATWRAELSHAFADDTIWRNNIGVAKPGAGILSWNRAILIGKSGNTVWENNISYNGTPGDISVRLDDASVTEAYMRENNLLGVDPLFADAPNQDFMLTAYSPAIDAGSDDIVSFIDINYWPRFRGTVDIGAFEFYDPPIPVELTSFEAVVTGATIRLSWTTASELNNAGFAVELRAPGHDFEQVLFVEGHGTTNTAHVYEATLENMAAGAYSLRLKQIDFDGAFEYSETVDVVVAADTYYLAQNYPNPFNPQTRIHYVLPVASHVTLEIFDLLGRSIRTLVSEEQVAGAHSVIFDAEELPNGLYLYRFTAGAFVESRTMILLR